MKEPSAEFLEALIAGGSIRVTCELCDKEHFVASGDYNEGELEDLRRQAKKFPGRFQEHTSSMVDYGYIAGKQAVIDCDCNKLRPYEDFILGHRRLIMEFLLKFGKSSLLSAETNLEKAKEFNSIINNVDELLKQLELNESKKPRRIAT